MADFCKQCAEDLFPGEFNDDLVGLVSKAQSAEGLFAPVLCEGCGSTYVDYKGYCKSSECLKGHGDY